MRVDDVVRTERHFCALLLSLLLDEELAGVRALVDLLVAEGLLGPTARACRSSPPRRCR